MVFNPMNGNNNPRYLKFGNYININILIQLN